jgi:hypothetical protein
MVSEVGVEPKRGLTHSLSALMLKGNEFTLQNAFPSCRFLRGGGALLRKSIKTGNNIEKFLVDRALAELVKCPVQIFQ